MEGRTVERMEGGRRKDVWREGRRNGRKGGGMEDGCMEGWRDGGMEGWKE